LAEATVVEIGSGSALCSLVAASQGARVTATDLSSLSLTLAQASVELNGIARDRFTTALLDWHSEAMPYPPQSFDVVIGSDVLFAQMNAPAIASVIAHSLKGGGLAIVLDPGRPSAEDFAAFARDKELEVEVLEASDLVVSKGRLLKLCRLFLLTSRRLAPSPRSAALRKGVLEGWQWLAERPRCSGSSSYEYTVKL
jgi:predicted nicotinamide N-methyase